jgi:hypothetical protein
VAARPFDLVDRLEVRALTVLWHGVYVLHVPRGLSPLRVCANVTAGAGRALVRNPVIMRFHPGMLFGRANAKRRDAGPARWLVCATLVSVFLAISSAATRTARAFPPRLEHYLSASVKLPAAQRAQLLGGAPVTRLLDADGSKEVAIFGAIWIDAPIKWYVDALQDIENFERGGGFRVTKRISSPPALEDFAQLHLTEEDVEDLRTCRVGHCEVKLSEPSLERFRAEIDWKAAGARVAADALMQRLAFEYVSGYLEGGNERLAVYRDKSRPTFVAREFRGLIDQMPELTTYMPAMRRYLLEYPAVSLPDSISFLYWQDTEFGLKPTIRISHVTIREGEDGTVITSKMLYASHYFWTGIELRALLPDPARGAGFWLVTVNRSRSDGLSGFSGTFVRRRVRSDVQEATLAALKGTRTRLELAR